ncbi:MAG: hypothetical protein EOM90_01375 [Alphaproteobacteria bacterium]|nr:hypothetical protein [Alphaproteobacteria bacterium]
MAITVKIVPAGASENFTDVDLKKETPLHIYVRCWTLGHRPSKNKIWKMTKAVGSGNVAEFNDFTLLDSNGVIIGDTVFIIER